VNSPLKTVVTSIGAFLSGLVVWYVLYLLLRASMGDTLSSQEEVTFKVGYCVIAIFGMAVAVALSWLLASRWRLSSLLAVLLVLFLIGLVAYPLAGLTSLANDCRYNLQWPIDNDFCD
jgi:peptidoglycan biosynthesis protein MviN/MurJ (putative lipid II flippase)